MTFVQKARKRSIMVAAGYPGRHDSGPATPHHGDMTGRRGPRAGLLVAVVVAVCTATMTVTPVDAAAPRGEPLTPGRAVAGRDTVVVGEVALQPCGVVARALCGWVRRHWDPDDPSAGTVRVGFAFVPARVAPAVGTLVPHEGGPGYATTASGGAFARMYGGLLRRRNLLLVDQRGTGRSEPVDCPRLQRGRGSFAEAVARCGRALGELADDYATTRSADDLAAVVTALGLEDIDLYGDSYGTFFAQVFAGRHPGLLRSVALDAAYPTFGESGWYPTSPPAAARSFRVVCRRSPDCAGAGRGYRAAMDAVLARVRRDPWRGWSHDADGRRTRVRVTPATLVSVVFGATYAPAFYREMTGALRSALRGDRVPLLRLVAEATGGSSDSGPPRLYSAGLELAVSCHDYAYVYDLALAPGRERVKDYRRALRRRSVSHPRTFRPFTVHEYARSDWQGLDWCLRWPTAPPSNPAGPVRPPGGGYPGVPVLLLTGELDTITTPAEARLVRGQFPDARLVVVRNSFHVTAVGDTDHCAVRILRAFVRAPEEQPARDRRRCAARVEPVRAVGAYPRRLVDVRPARGDAEVRSRRAAAAAAGTAADLLDRWWNNYSGHGVGLRGGTWTYRGGRVVRFRLDGVRLVADLAVDGQVVWDRYGERVEAQLRLRGGVRGRLEGAWDTRAVGATAVLVGRLDGVPVRVRLPAP
jgi:pimeloyl-ACP methyl ester carboxylesterase